MSNYCHASVLVSGRVQGVYYRGSLQKVARSLNLVGHVRNLTNGSVEFVAKGSENDVRRLIDWSKKGPPMAQVTEVTIESCRTIDAPAVSTQKGDSSTFDILY